MPPTNNKTESAFANWLISKGIAKNESGANIIMIVFIVVSFSFSIYLIV